MSDTLVLCYHALSERWPANLAVRPERFAEQVAWLHRHGYRGVTFSEAVQGGERGRRVAVTFDDGFSSVAEIARPILDRFGFPGTLFAVSSFAASGEPLRWPGISQWGGTEHEDELAGLAWEPLRELASAGWEIGSHTVTHPWLTRIDDAMLDRELSESRAAVAEAIGAPCRSIAYPYGDVDARVEAAAQRAGYETGGALPEVWPKPKPLRWPRNGIYHADGMGRFQLKVSPTVRLIRQLVRR